MLNKIANLIIVVGRMAAWVILPIMIIVICSIVFSAFNIGKIIEWKSDIFLFGTKLTLASLGDLQWYMFGFLVMLSLAGTLLEDKHVRVDFIRIKMNDKKKQIVDLLGHLIFMIPFCLVVLIHSFDFAKRAFLISEGSDYDGLYDRFVVKGLIPLGTLLLIIATLLLIVKFFRKNNHSN